MTLCGNQTPRDRFAIRSPATSQSISAEPKPEPGESFCHLPAAATCRIEGMAGTSDQHRRTGQRTPKPPPQRPPRRRRSKSGAQARPHQSRDVRERLTTFPWTNRHEKGRREGWPQAGLLAILRCACGSAARSPPLAVALPNRTARGDASKSSQGAPGAFLSAAAATPSVAANPRTAASSPRVSADDAGRNPCVCGWPTQGVMKSP